MLAASWLHMQKEEEDPNVLISRLKQHRAEDCTGVWKMRCSKSTAKQKSFQEFQSFESFQAEINIHFWPLRICPLPPSSPCSSIHLWYTATLAHFHKSVPEREKSGVEREGGGSEKAGAMEKRDSEDLHSLKSPA